MSDYLNSLVGRALRLEPVVQPRPTSLFEPVASGPFNEAAPAEVFESHSTRDNSWPSRETSNEVSEIPVEKRERVSAHQEPDTVVQSRLIPATLAPAPKMPPSLFSLTDPENTGAVRDQEPSAVFADQNEVSSTSESTPLLIRPAVRVVPPASDHEQNQPPLRTSPVGPVLAPAASPSPFAPARNLNPQVSAPADAPETVVITIGRVDVRAVFPQPQAVPRSDRTQPKALSLDEYLKQRNEGRR